MTATLANNVVLVKDGLTITIATQPNDEENLTKGLTNITPPKPTGNQSTNPNASDYGPNATKIVDILSKVEQRITINGFFEFTMSMKLSEFLCYLA